MTPWYSHPIWALLTFALGWLVISGLVAHLGGWASLAKSYATQQDPSGDRFRFVSGSMGSHIFPVSYGSCLFVSVDARGIYLSIFFPFRFLCPPLFLPWKSLENLVEKRVLFFRAVRMTVRDAWPQITLKGRAGQAVLGAYELWKAKGRPQL